MPSCHLKMLWLVLPTGLLVWLPTMQARCGDASANCTILGCDADGWSAHCRYANLTCVPACIPTSTDLLDLSYNDLAIVTADSFQDFPNVSYIDLSNNKIQTLPSDVFVNVPLLGALILDNNPLLDLPDDFLFNSPQLYSLTIDNVLTRPIINANIISNSSELAFISISRSQLMDFSATTLMNLKKLQHLYWGDNLLNDIPADAFRYNAELKTVDIGSNNLSSLPLNVFSALTELSDLYLNGNNFADVSSDLFLSNHNLRLLDLGKNQLTALDDLIFQPLSSLETLYLYGNRLSDVVASFEYNGDMWILDLRNNTFTNLSSSSLATNSRLILWLEGNPWDCGCWTLELLAFVESRNSTVGDEPVCQEPPELTGTSWLDLADVLVC